jgi:peptidoglycan/LPS O-acetylase OafA/YrhL
VATAPRRRTPSRPRRTADRDVAPTVVRSATGRPASGTATPADRWQREDANNFTLLRLLLAVMVVFGHFRILAGGSSAEVPYNFADAAVDCFFVVSGFLIAGSFERSRGVLAFYTRRVFRLLPMYAFVVLAQTVVLVSLLPGGPLAAPGDTLRYLVCNLVFANFAQHDIGGLLQSSLLVPTLNPSLWTLKIEIGFYLIAPAVLLAARRWGGGVLAAIFVASAIYQAAALRLGLDQYARQLPGQMQFFVVGIALYRYGANIRVSAAVSVLVSIAFIAAWTWLWPIPSGVRPLVVGAFVFCFALRLPALPIRADLSYSVYLQHGPLIQILLFLGLYQDRVWVLGAVLLSVLALSFATEQLIEKPGIALGKRIARRIERLPLGRPPAFAAALAQPAGKADAG